VSAPFPGFAGTSPKGGRFIFLILPPLGKGDREAVEGACKATRP
jgi:hypothetical protein